MSWQDPNPFRGQGGGAPSGGEGGGNPFGGAGQSPMGAGGQPPGPGPGTQGNPFDAQQPGYQQGIRPPGVPSPPRRGGRPVLIAVAVVAVLVVAGAVGVWFLPGSGAESPPQTAPQLPGPASTAGPPTATPSPSPSRSPRATEPSPSAPPPPLPPPPAPRSQVPIDPPTGPYRGTKVLADNALYGVSMGRWSCAGMDPAAPERSEQARAWVEKAIDCMMERYRPAVEQVGGTLTRPRASYFTGSFTSPCGTWRNIVAYYCGGDSIIYIDYAVLSRYDDNVRLGAIHLLFHEFGHHVQSRVGILSAGANAQAEDANQRQRRLELQVECFTYIQVQTWDQWTPADEPQYRNWAAQDQDALHGTGKSFTYWFERSIGQQKLGACNTWVAPRNRVT